MTAPASPGPGPTGPDLPALLIRTERLNLVAVSADLAEAEIHDRVLLAEGLKAEVPGNWPPELRLDSLTWTWEQLRQDPGLRGWLDWYVVLRSPPAPEPILIGSVGFQGRPILLT